MFVDSHCHLSDPSLRSQINSVLQQMAQARVSRALCISTTLDDFDVVNQLVQQHDNLWASIGVHPEEDKQVQPTIDDLLSRVRNDKVVAIGETGLDYFHFSEHSHAQLQWQRDRFQVHIDAAREAKLPLIIHTREAAQDTLAQLKAAVNASGVTQGVIHCFTETPEIAKRALDLGFYISFTGILTFRNATQLREVAKMVPRDACLIETDSPYLAPVPYRGKTNTPALVPYVAAALADIWQIPVEDVAQQTSANFDRLFPKVRDTLS